MNTLLPFVTALPLSKTEIENALVVAAGVVENENTVPPPILVKAETRPGETATLKSDKIPMVLPKLDRTVMLHTMGMLARAGFVFEQERVVEVVGAKYVGKVKLPRDALLDDNRVEMENKDVEELGITVKT